EQVQEGEDTHPGAFLRLRQRHTLLHPVVRDTRAGQVGPEPIDANDEDRKQDLLAQVRRTKRVHKGRKQATSSCARPTGGGEGCVWSRMLTVHLGWKHLCSHPNRPGFPIVLVSTTAGPVVARPMTDHATSG